MIILQARALAALMNWCSETLFEMNNGGVGAFHLLAHGEFNTKKVN
jgi:hypothetical protein